MFLNKAEAFARRGFHVAKTHAAHAYKTGMQMAKNVDWAYGIAKRLHSTLAPQLKDAGVYKHTKKAMSNFEEVRGKVMGAHESAERVVHSVKRTVPELGL
jgi:hypothetical protein